MEHIDGMQALTSVLPTEPLVGIHNVARSMAQMRSHLKSADLSHFESFAFSYHAVTTNVEDKVDAQRAFGMDYFKQPQVLDSAIGNFYYLESKQLTSDEVEPHWKALLEDERARHVDHGTQAALGYIAHIGGDLAQTVYQTEASGLYSPTVMKEYVKFDYPKIDKLLAHTAQKIAPELLPFGNDQMRKVLVGTAMSGIIFGRKYALKDYVRLTKASSEDERQHIINRSHERTAKVANSVLSLSYNLHKTVKRQFPSGAPANKLAA